MEGPLGRRTTSPWAAFVRPLRLEKQKGTTYLLGQECCCWRGQDAEGSCHRAGGELTFGPLLRRPGPSLGVTSVTLPFLRAA